ncbi:TadE family protein [Oxalicibacterium faecigallinarum]|nr:TadE family protein [Oxalicibacterium faecigallinarum]
MSATCHQQKIHSGGESAFSKKCPAHHFAQQRARSALVRGKGAAAIEFALVFPLFFIVFYGILTYGMIMLAQQSITLAAAEGARAALRHVPEESARETNAKEAATGTHSVAAWLGTKLAFTGTSINCPYTSGADPVRCYSVTVRYPYGEHPLIPLLLGPLMQVVVPETLSSTAIVQID